jgi:LmbE family N-acetylglucosaminyl deacetylase
VITHNADDIHPDHQQAAQTLLAALPKVVIMTEYPRRVYTCDGYHNVHRDGRPLHLPVIVDVTNVMGTKMRTLARHLSQPIDQHFALMAQTLGCLRGRRIGVRYAEAFAPLPILGRLPASPHL